MHVKYCLEDGHPYCPDCGKDLREEHFAWEHDLNGAIIKCCGKEWVDLDSEAWDASANSNSRRTSRSGDSPRPDAGVCESDNAGRTAEPRRVHDAGNPFVFRGDSDDYIQQTLSLLDHTRNARLDTIRYLDAPDGPVLGRQAGRSISD